MKTMISTVAVLLFGMLVTLGSTNAPPAFKLVPLTLKVSKKNVTVVEHQVPRLGISLVKQGTVSVRVYGPPGQYALIGFCPNRQDQDELLVFKMPAAGSGEIQGPTSYPGGLGWYIFNLVRKGD